MYRSISRFIVVLLATAAFACSSVTASPVTIPDPIVDAPLATAKSDETVVLAGGCFWGIQAVFQHVKGVKAATSGYAGGSVKAPDYETVSSGTTGHAESVEIIYDPSQISIGQLLKVFFSVAHDPTELNRQGPDTGTQYRSAIFFKNADHKRIAKAYIDQLNQAKVFKRPIATQLVAYNGFYKAEAYHQDYARLHPDEPYIAINDLPKVENLRKQFPSLYVSR
jgi:peptide-methionine (S)-S-oxide reductase